MRNVKDTNIDNKPIYRFMKFSYLEEMISKQELKIAKISSWDDTYENFFFKSNFKLVLENGITVTSSDKILESFWGQCWTVDKDSAALWHIYSPDKKSVRIKTTIKKLRDVVDADQTDKGLSYFEFVEYKSKNDLKDWLDNKQKDWLDNKQNPTDLLRDFSESANESLFIKRDLFSYENEFRVIYNGDTSLDKDDFKTYKININDFIEEIVFDPRIKSDCYMKARCKLMKQSIQTNKIRKSTLYDFKPFDIQVNF